MKVSKLVMLLLTSVLSGCAHHVGYHGSYAGYDSYYGRQGYSAYPGTSYHSYRPGPRIYYDRQYTPPPASHHHDRHDDHHFQHRDSRPETHRDYRPHWKPHALDGRRQHSDNRMERSRPELGARRDGLDSLGRLPHRQDHAPALPGARGPERWRSFR
ncbi:MAG: hypothetical protein PHH11_11240 [Methylomonas sp.]|nr:hypothetical protein [Methylomonas sp.]